MVLISLKCNFINYQKIGENQWNYWQNFFISNFYQQKYLYL
jgi:hypothetical protein